MIVLLTLAAVGDDDFDAIVRGLLAGVVAFTIFFLLHMISPRSMGFGDVKLAFVLGLSLGWLGWGEVLLGLFLGFLYGAVIGLVLIATRCAAKSQALPFGPFLAAGALTAILVGDSIINWYRGQLTPRRIHCRSTCAGRKSGCNESGMVRSTPVA